MSILKLKSFLYLSRERLLSAVVISFPLYVANKVRDNQIANYQNKLVRFRADGQEHRLAECFVTR